MKFLILVSVLIAFIECLPQGGRKPVPPQKPNETYKSDGKPLVFPGFDIKFTEKQIRSGIIDKSLRWKNGLFVQIDGSFSELEKETINSALYELHINICIGILIWPSDSKPIGDYVFIKRGGYDSGCWSHVGRLGERQVLNLQYNGCVHRGVVMHEVIHALGFYHEQSRPDRDEHVEIIWDNIIPEYRFGFEKFGWDFVETFDVPYDLKSIMHYNAWDYSQNGEETIRSLNGSPLGSEEELTEKDLTKLKRMYNC